jgi:hypothetical protein
MDQNTVGLSEEQQNDCRAVLEAFIDRHHLSDWGMMVNVQQTTPGKYSLKIELTPPPESELPVWPLQEISLADASCDAAADIDKLLELAYQARFSQGKTDLAQ